MMRFPYPTEVEDARVKHGDMASNPGDAYGFFLLWHNGHALRVLASTGEEAVTEGWEHVSVSTKEKRPPPNWSDMCYVKNLFWSEDECVLQFHPPAEQYVNNFSTCLHLWKPPYPVVMPPPALVGIKELGELA